jgi:hypothetical protein
MMTPWELCVSKYHNTDLLPKLLFARFPNLPIGIKERLFNYISIFVFCVVCTFVCLFVVVVVLAFYAIIM